MSTGSESNKNASGNKTQIDILKVVEVVMIKSIKKY